MPTPADFPPRWFPLRLRVKDSQSKALWNCKRRFVGVDAGRQSYKTELAKRKLVMSLIEPKPWPDPRYFYGAPTQRQAKLIAWEDIKQMVPKRWIRDPERDIRESELMIRTGFGSEIHVIGMDKPERIEGKSWDGGALDECSDLKWREAERAIFPMLAARNGWLWRLGVPKRSGIGAIHFRKFCEDARTSADPETAAFSWPSSDVLSDDQLRWYREHWDAKDCDEQLGGHWQDGGGGIFHAFSTANIRACTFDPDAPMIVSCDFNVDPMAWVLGHPRDGGRYIEWFDEIWERDTNTPAVLDILWDRYGDKTHGTIAFYGDATGRARRSSASFSDYQHIMADKRFRDKGATVHFPAGNPPVADRFAACNAVLRNALGNVRCFFDPRCEHLLIDVQGRGYKAGTTEPADSGDVGHATDAWGYATYMLYPIETDDGEARVIIHSGHKTGGNGNGNGKGGNGNGRRSASDRIRRNRYARR